VTPNGLARSPHATAVESQTMRVMTARVVDGKIDVGDAELQDGAAVAVLIPDASGFQLSEDDQEELELALSEIQHGNFTDGRELLRELKGMSGR
jgi:hypothetical protein